MYRCLQLARLGEYYVAPNPMVGAVLVGHVVGDEQVRILFLVRDGMSNMVVLTLSLTVFAMQRVLIQKGLIISHVRCMSVWNLVVIMARLLHVQN